MLAFLLAAAFVILPEIHVEAGTTVNEVIDVGWVMPNGGRFYVEDESLAVVRGAVHRMQSKGEITIEALQPGETRLMMGYVSGMSVWQSPIAMLVVDPPCAPAAIAVTERDLRVLDGQPVTLHALTAGTAPVRVEWREDDTLLGAGDTLTVTLPRGVHRITARVENKCGAAASEIEVTVFRMRRRSMR